MDFGPRAIGEPDNRFGYPDITGNRISGRPVTSCPTTARANPVLPGRNWSIKMSDEMKRGSTVGHSPGDQDNASKQIAYAEEQKKIIGGM